MLQSFFNGLSGMFSFSRGLQTVSNNISNMNTPGFRGSDNFFRSLNGGGGLGTSLNATTMRTGSGEMRQTSNATDLALNGTGFFVLRDENGQLFYTRAGQFQFDENGILIDTVSKAQVMGQNSAGNFVAISIQELRTLPAEATTAINFVGNFVAGSASHTVSDTQVFDAAGTVHRLTTTFTNASSATSTNTWTVQVAESNGTVVGTGQIRFGPDGSPLAGFNTVSIALPVNGTTQNITLNFGEPGSFSGSTQFSGSSSTVGARVQDGHAVLGLTEVKFDEKGMLNLTYSNGDKREGERLALASFADESALLQSTGSLYIANGATAANYGYAGTGVFGKVQGGNIELSNVDLTQEFADMMIIQRGYQASSRVMSVSNDMIEQLYNSSRGG